MIIPIDCANMGGTAIDPRVCVIQDGARLHYAVPIALQREGILERVYTDWYNAPGSAESFLTKIIRLAGREMASRLSQRFSPELSRSLVHSRPSLLWAQYRGRRRFENELEMFAWLRDRFGQWVCSSGFGNSNGLFGFVRNISPAICQAAKEAGLKVVTDQIIAPFEIEQREIAIQESRFPGWNTERADGQSNLGDVERHTWALSDRITCASDYVRDGLIQCGVEASKIDILPYPFDAGKIRATDRRGRAGPVTVGFVGKVGLRKGAPYIFELARRFDPAVARFVLVGDLRIEPSIAEKNRRAVELVGPVPRSEVVNWLERFDVFLLPSTCEGSAGAVNEAMAAGLPVIVSPNSGSWVRDGVEGFITEYDDIDKMEHSLRQLLDSPQRRHEMGLAGRARVEEFTVSRYGSELAGVFGQLIADSARVR